MAVTTGIKYTDPIDHGFNAPYDGIDIKPDRQGGWLVRHAYLDGWITAVPDRPLADRIHEALVKVVEKAAVCAEDALEARQHRLILSRDEIDFMLSPKGTGFLGDFTLRYGEEAVIKLRTHKKANFTIDTRPK